MALDFFDLSEQQHGVIARRQAHTAEMPGWAVRRYLAGPDWEPITRQVLRRRGAPVTDDQRCMAAVLDAGDGAAISHHSAAALWGLPGFDLTDLHVVLSHHRTRRDSPLATIHYLRSLPLEHLRRVRGIAVTSPALALFHLAGSLAPGRVARALDTAWARGLVTGHGLHDLLEQLGERGRPGLAAMRSILAVRPPGYIPAESGNERRFEWILQRGGERPMRRQVNVGGDHWIGRFDFAHEDLPLLAAINGDVHHTAYLDVQHDEDQITQARAQGFTVLVFTEFQVWHRPEEVLAAVRETRRALRSHSGSQTARSSVRFGNQNGGQELKR